LLNNLLIASKCDDISCSEVIRALQLEDDPVLEEIEGRIEEANEQVKALKDEKEAATKEIKRRLKLIDYRFATLICCLS